MGNYLPNASKTRWLWLKLPFVMPLYWIKRRREWRRIIPRLWLSSGELLTEDLNLYEVEAGKPELDQKFIEDFAKARDELHSLIKKQIIIGVLAFIFLLANYFSISLDMSIAGIPLKYAPGIPEGLLVISNLLACYTIVLQGNTYLIESAIKCAIAKAIPEELRFIYLVRYFPHEMFPAYRPFNLPHIIPNKFSRGLLKSALLAAVALLVLSAIIYATANFYLLLHYLLLHPNFGIWSYLIFAYLIALGATSLIYLILTRCRLPYLDYTVNNELELLKQVDPQKYRSRLSEIYDPLNTLEYEMKLRGYLK